MIVVMGKSHIESYMPNPKSSNTESQTLTSNPNLKSLEIHKSFNTQISNLGQILHRFVSSK